MTAAEPSRTLLALQAAVAGRYSIERVIGRGGMGTVYLARDVALDRPVAMKVLRGGGRDRFLQEARTAARLSHPNIVPIFAVDEAGQFVFFVMGYVQGETLRQRVAARGPLPVHAGIRILRDVAWALAYAHAQGVVHRDVKPENILLEAGTDRALVTDFGIAQVRTAEDVPLADQVLGTPECMSPEQASGEVVDHRSDLYSLGVVAFYLFSGRPPFQGPGGAALLAQHIATPPPPLGRVAPGVPRRVAALVDQCLAKAPADRVQGGEQLAEALAVSLERGRELPPAVRAFISERKAASGRTVVVVALAPWLMAVFGGLLFSGQFILTALGAMLAGALIGSPPAGALLSARRLLRAGHGRDDAVHGLEQDLERRHEELAHLYGDQHEDDARRLRRTGQLGMLAALVGASAIAAVSSLPPMLTLAPVIAVLASAVAWYRGDKRTDVKGKQRLKLWRGLMGKLVFRAAGVGLEVPTEAPALTQRPTEVAVGMVVEGLFQALPRSARDALGDLPHVVRSLEADARRMRERIQELDGLLADATHSARGGGDQAAEDLAAQLRATREDATQRLAATVAALERLRIDLLRLRAGNVTIDGVTANLGEAREVSAQVQRLLAGYQEVERALRSGTSRSSATRS